MSTDYFASFEPVALSRQDIAYAICDAIFELDASVDMDFDRLDIENGHYIPTHDYIENESLLQAIKATPQWPAIQLHIVYEEQICDITILNDIPNKITMVFSEPKSLYHQQINGMTTIALLELLLLFMRVTGASFCVFEPGWIRKSRVLADIRQWIDELSEGRESDWEFVIVDEDKISLASLPPSVKQKVNISLIEELGIWYYSIE